MRSQPIPPPNNLRQYRAIGLIQGKYQPSALKITRGTLLTTDGTIIEAVLLGRIMSLLKHLDLSKEHLWVVYPRTRQPHNHLHFQLVGVWQPETSVPKETEIKPELSIENGYFSVRGEVIFAAPERQKVIVKIRQSPKPQENKPKFFKVELKGTLSEHPVGHFWDLQACLQGETLVIEDAVDVGLASLPKKAIPTPPKLAKPKPIVNSTLVIPRIKPKPN